MKGENTMKRITVNNTTVKRDEAIMNAIEINDQTGVAVEVCNAIGDTIYFVDEDGNERYYDL